MRQGFDVKRGLPVARFRATTNNRHSTGESQKCRVYTVFLVGEEFYVEMVLGDRNIPLLYHVLVYH